MDMVVRTPRLPLPGETVLGSEFGTFPGGKGANQAIAAVRQGAEVNFIGNIGVDGFGQKLLENCVNEGVGTQYIGVDEVLSTGIAVITLDDFGENSIVVAPGANYSLNPRHIEERNQAFISADLLLSQLEIPLDVVISAARKAKEFGLTTILNPAPAQVLPDKLLKMVDILVPNEHECAILSGMPVTSLTEIEDASRSILARGVGCVIVTMGAQGALLIEPGQLGIHVPSFEVAVIDTTAAGDSFLGTLAVAVAEGKSLREGVRRACAAGALATTRLGAHPSIPTKVEVDELLEANE